MAVSLQKTPTYQAEAKILVTTQGSSILNGANGDAVRTLANEAALATSDQFRALVTKQVGRPIPVSAKPSTDSDVLIFTAKAPTAAKAAKNVNDYAKAFVDIRKQIAQTGLESQSKELQSNIDADTQRLAQLDAQEQQIRDQVTAAGADDNQVKTLQNTLQNLVQSHTDERQNLNSQLGSLRDRQQLIGLLDVVSTSGQPQSDVSVLKLANVPKTPVSPNIPQDATIAIVIGLLLGLCVAYGREQLEDHVRGRLDLETDFPEIPVLAAIPYDRDSESEIATADRGKSQVAESYRKLRTALEFLSLSQHVGVVQITSSSAGEGKTTIAVNLAAAVAQAGQNVVLLCADFRIPRAHHYFDLDNEVGLAQVLQGEADLGSVVHKTQVENLYVVPSGKVPINPAELLDSDTAHRVVEMLSKKFDLVVVDTPPVLPVADPLITATMVDAVLMVVRSRQSRRRQVRRSMETLEQVQVPVAGLVLNNESAEEAHAYGYGYGYYGKGYGAGEAPKSKPRNGSSNGHVSEESLPDLPVSQPVGRRN